MRPGEAGRIVALIAAAYPSPSWPDETLGLYRRMLEDLDYRTTNEAVLAWIRSRKERPAVADLREAVRRKLCQAGLIPRELDEDEAWGYVERMRREVGHDRPFPQNGYPEVAEVVSRMSWVTLCLSNNPQADRAHFLQLFKLEKERRRQARLSAPGLALAGDAALLAEQRRIAKNPRRRLVEKRPVAKVLEAPASRQSALVQLRQIITDLNGGSAT